ncbi:uncharacterized protein [Atheta coriaria]|uniref:uncharacterized protein n=1 Tax=Dalotia coriaria TaxID=877792 RepID=UPI0031F3955F
MTDYDFTTIARNVATRENIKDYKLEYQYSSKKGDGYTGTVRAVTIIGSNKKLEVVFKYSHRDPRVHENLPLREIYINEIQFYEEIAPAFASFQARYNVEQPFNNTAKYYGCINEALNECLALENLRCNNHDLWDRKKLMDSAHLELALKTFAKLHGTSMAMKKLDPELYMKITAAFGEFNIWADFFQKADMYRQVSDIIQSFNYFDLEKPYADKLEHFRVNIHDVMNAVVTYHDQYDVIVQGDCWSNNAMYQYHDMNDRSKPKNVTLLDWQIIASGSVIMDLSYFFYTIAEKSCMDNLDYFMKLYHDSMSDHLKAFGLDIEDVYPYEVFYKAWKKLSIFGFLMTFTLRKMMLIEAKDTFDFAEGLDDFMLKLHLTKDQEEVYKEQMRDIVMHFVDQNMLE